MNFLFVHQYFPGQFTHLSASLAANKKHRVVALGLFRNPVAAGVELRTYAPLRNLVPQQHPLVREIEAKALLGEACAAAALKLRSEGFVPDIIVAHPGWGEALFLRDVFPLAKIAVYCEFYYAAEGRDVGFDPEVPPVSFEQRCALRMRNAHNLLSMEVADIGISPTQWQRSTYPAWLRDRIHVIHDGIDQARLKPDPKASLQLAPANAHEGVTLQAGDEVITYVARNLEPVRGFHMFMRMLPQVLRQRPAARAVIVGGDERGYGHAPPAGKTWRQLLLEETAGSLDLSRVHFLGKVPYDTYLRVLQVSKVHTYWTTPFVLSWSFLEAASMGVPLVGSDTPPVQEFAEPAGCETVDFFDTLACADMVTDGLSRRAAARKPRKMPGVELKRCVKAQEKLLLQL